MSTRPAWLSDLVQQVCACLHGVEDFPPIGCHVAEIEDCWEVTVFVSPTEIVGGEYDGERLSCLFVVDTLQLLQIFDGVESASWQPHVMSDLDDLGSHMAVIGDFSGHSVWLRILAETPERYPVGRQLDLYGKRFIDSWQL